MSISTVTVLGAGVIGASWAALFIADNHRTIVYDTNPEAESVLLNQVQSALSRLSQLTRYQALPVWEDLATAVATTELIQENTPENLQLKLNLFRTLEKPSTVKKRERKPSSAAPPPASAPRNYRSHSKMTTTPWGKTSSSHAPSIPHI